MKRELLELIAVPIVVAASLSSFAHDQKGLIATYSDFAQWLRDNAKPEDRQINLLAWTNKCSSMTNLIQLGREVQGRTFEDLVTSIETVGGVSVRQPRYKVFAATNYGRLQLTFVIPTNGLSSETWEMFNKRVKHFVALREESMSSNYGFDSLRVSRENPAKSATESLRERIRRVDWVPDAWIAKEYSTEDSAIVIDGKFAWKFRPYLSPMGLDAMEFDPKLGPIIAQAQIDAMKGITNNGLESTSPINLWRVAQRTLRERHQIDWLSPADLNRDFLSRDMLRLFSSTNTWWLTNR